VTYTIPRTSTKSDRAVRFGRELEKAMAARKCPSSCSRSSGARRVGRARRAARRSSPTAASARRRCSSCGPRTSTGKPGADRDAARVVPDEARRRSSGSRRRLATDGSTGRIVVTNYERLHHFDPADFGGVVCDESSAIKSFDGRAPADRDRVHAEAAATGCSAPRRPRRTTTSSSARRRGARLPRAHGHARPVLHEQGNKTSRGKGYRWRTRHVRRRAWRFKGTPRSRSGAGSLVGARDAQAVGPRLRRRRLRPAAARAPRARRRGHASARGRAVRPAGVGAPRGARGAAAHDRERCELAAELLADASRRSPGASSTTRATCSSG
jgi:hypothetical protein